MKQLINKSTNELMMRRFEKSTQNYIVIRMFANNSNRSGTLNDQHYLRYQHAIMILLADPGNTSVHEPSAKNYQLSCLHRRRWRKRRKIGIWVEDYQILPVLEVWRR